MQILNISVQNRPSRSVTSRPYAVELLESVDYSTAFNKVNLFNINFLETAATSVGMLDGYIRDLLVRYKYREDVGSSITISDVQLTHDVVYTKYRMDKVVLDNSVSINDVHITREVRYITTKLDREDCSQIITLSDVRLV